MSMSDDFDDEIEMDDVLDDASSLDELFDDPYCNECGEDLDDEGVCPNRCDEFSHDDDDDIEYDDDDE